jgi:hypothetical protein
VSGLELELDPRARIAQTMGLDIALDRESTPALVRKTSHLWLRWRLNVVDDEVVVL